MPKTDRQTDKSTRWAFTAYEGEWSIVDDFNKSAVVAEYGYQEEICPETGRKHRQGFLRTKTQIRFSGLVREFPGIHFEVAKNWEALINYCKKEETRSPGAKFISGTGSKEKPLTMAQALMKLVSFADPKPIMHQIPIEKGKDYRYEFNFEFDWKAMYVSGVRNWIAVNPEIIALVTQPQYKSAFSDFWRDFEKMAVRLAEAEVGAHSITGTDSQEDDEIEPEYEDFTEYGFSE